MNGVHCSSDGIACGTLVMVIFYLPPLGTWQTMSDLSWTEADDA